MYSPLFPLYDYFYELFSFTDNSGLAYFISTNLGLFYGVLLCLIPLFVVKTIFSFFEFRR